MKCVAIIAAVLAVAANATLLRGDAAAPHFKGKVDNSKNFATSGNKPARAPGYRAAWDDCGGVGASATERMRTVAAKIKGWAKPLPFVRHAAQDCGHVHPSGRRPGPGRSRVFPAPSIPGTIRNGINTADSTLRKYR